MGSLSANIDLGDLVILVGLGVATIAYLARRSRPPKPSEAEAHLALLSRTLAEKKAQDNGQLTQSPTSDGLIDRMKKTNKNIVVFFGSQTGTAEDFASRLAKDANGYGFRAITADPGEHDISELENLPENKLAIFILATYGEGEPTDNFLSWHESLETSFGDGFPEKTMSNLSYALFGAGNKTYEHFNAEARHVDKWLTALGGSRIGERGEGDDDANIEEDYSLWKTGILKAICDFFNADPSILEKKASLSREFTLKQFPADSIPAFVYTGELHDREGSSQSLSTSAAYDQKNPYYATINSTKQLFNCIAQADAGETHPRKCLHVEIDISGSGMTYQAGDHIGIWPTNSGEEVLNLAKALKLLEQQDGVPRIDQVICLTADDPDARKKHPFPCPTTYRTALTHYLDIQSTIKPYHLELFKPYLRADSEEDLEQAKCLLERLIDDHSYFNRVMHDNKHVTIGDFLNAHPSFTVDVGVVLESLPRLQCRYYSISSSGKVFPETVHITASVLRYETGAYALGSQRTRVVKGVCTNYFLDIHQSLEGGRDPRQIRVPCYIRHSNFHLPESGKPVLMVGPGTGVAPFRGFAQELALARSGGDAERIRAVAVAGNDTPAAGLVDGAVQKLPVAASHLYYGCRHSAVDYLYQAEWPIYQTLGGLTDMHVAFSRDTEKKVYVQHLLKAQSDVLWDTIISKGGYIYVCGDAKNMARDVSAGFAEIARDKLGLESMEKAEEYVKELRSSGKYLEDVWS